ncbi:hypothetical protein GCM10023350_22590 [Nocardioides endophyticus]|uniref:Ig-like domain-containing protein n=1 Tax=Nocardioides endophyticus TaxID=1353775 RepID=A0ABP8YUJ9_9ACTN
MSRRSRWVSGLVTATLTLSGLAQLGLAAPASAAGGGPCAYDGPGSVSLDGAPAVGAPVTATVVGAGAGRARYTWSGTGFGGPVHGATFTARPDVVGAPVHLAVQVRTTGGRTFAASCDLARVGWGHLARPEAPTVTGRPIIGGTLHATSSGPLPAGAAYHYEWFLGDSPSAFATGADLDLGRSQVGSTLTVKAMVTAPGRRDSSWSTATVTAPVVEDTLVQPGAPSISGVAAMAGTLTAHPAAGDDFPGDTTYEYRWLADGVQFATGAQITLAAAQVGHAITVQDRATATGFGASEWSASSAATATVTPGFLTAPSAVAISGTPTVGSTLTAVVTGGWTPGTQADFSWKADGVPFSTAPGAVTLTDAEVGRTITVEITGSLAGYVSRSIVSPATSPVGGVPLPDLGAPSAVTVAGTAKVGRSLTASATGSWTPGAAVTYVWKADGRTFGGNAATVVLSARELGARITVTETGTLAGYRPATVTSAPTARVTAGTLTAPKPTVHGKAKLGRTLTARPGRWTPGTRLTYRWFANGKPIAGATAARLRLTKKLDHRRITVQVTGRLSGYATVTRASRATGRVR